MLQCAQVAEEVGEAVVFCDMHVTLCIRHINPPKKAVMATRAHPESGGETSRSHCTATGLVIFLPSLKLAL